MKEDVREDFWRKLKQLADGGRSTSNQLLVQILPATVTYLVCTIEVFSCVYDFLLLLSLLDNEDRLVLLLECDALEPAE